MGSIGFIGAGNMAEAIIRGLVASNKYDAGDIYISDTKQRRLDELCEVLSLRGCDDNRQLASSVDVLVLSVKPQNMVVVLETIAGSLKDDCLVISIAAGIRVGMIAEHLGDMAIARVMPNTPALTGAGMSGIFVNEKAGDRVALVQEIFDSVGQTVVVDREELIDAVTAVSGSGPAYFFQFMEEMIKSGIELGLDEATATKLVLNTAYGAAKLALEGDKQNISVARLRENVTSPGGTTQAALSAFEDDQIGATILVAMERAYLRSRELSE